MVIYLLIMKKEKVDKYWRALHLHIGAIVLIQSCHYSSIPDQDVPRTEPELA